MADVHKKIIFDASMNITQVKNAVDNIQKAMSGITMPSGAGSNFEKTLTKLGTEITRFEQRASQGLSSAADFKELERSSNRITSLFQDLQVYIKQLGNNENLKKMIPPEMAKNIEKAKNAFSAYNSEIKKSQSEVKKQETAIARTTKTVNDLKQKMDVISNKKIVKSNELSQLKKDAVEAGNNVVELERQLADLNQKAELKASNLTQKNKSSTYRELVAEIAQTEAELNKARAASEALNNQLGNTTTLDKQQAELSETEQKLNKAETELKEMTQTLQNMQQVNEAQALQSLFNVLSQIPGLDMSQFAQTAEGAAQAIQYLLQQGLSQASQNVDQMRGSVEQASPAIQNLGNNVSQAGQDFKDFNQQANELENLKQRLVYFFGLNNAINLFKRAVRSAFQTVKELDATMTEIAVVSEFDISDMWNKLPDFIDQANDLGVSVNEAYKATTLFVQQGLNLNDSMKLSAETLKMARIAGLDAAEATDAMTAALRGFNMELDETSAEKVNDVYSKLAAITASDVQEISTAMTKTASIASNANMEFETTAAFLSQIIETTRESAETAGTAMKTVIARFQELKKDPTEIGEVDGEIVDANKIETALRTIGVSLRDTSGQFRDLDDVFLEIASKWDNLDTNTQRYIATMAAGSRQQSRFIAMMSNYERTMELVDAANNSAGASQEQFEKTLDSLGTKLSQLKNAWNEFAMGLANNEIIKAAVDALTWIIETLNKMIDVLSMDSGAIKSLLSLTTAFLGLSGGKAIVKQVLPSAINGLKALATGTQVATGTTLGLTSAVKSLGVALFTTPIGWITLALTALIGVFALAHAATQKEERKLKRLNEEMQEAKEAAEEAKTAYDDLLSSFEEYDIAQEKLEGLTKGTQEWKEALVEANNQVLEMLQTFPELARYLVRDENGVLTFSEEGRSKYVEEQQSKVEQATLDYISSQIAVTVQEQVVANEEPATTTVEEIITEYRRAQEQNDTDKIKQLENIWAKSGSKDRIGIGMTLAEIDSALGLETALETSYNQIVTYQGYSLEELAQMEADYFARNQEILGYVSSALTVGASDELTNSKYGAAIQDFFANTINLEDFMGLTEEEQKEMLQSTIDGMNNFYDKFAQFNSEQQDIIARSLSTDGKSLTKDMVKIFELPVGRWKENYLAAANLTEEEFEIMLEALDLSEGEFFNQLRKNAELATQEFEKAAERLKVNGIHTDLIFQNLDAETVGKLSNELYQVLITQGRAAASQLSGLMYSVTKDMSPKDAEDFVDALTGLDWSSKDSVESFSEVLDTLRINTNMTDEEIERFEQQVINLAGAVNKVTFDNVKEQLKSLTDIANEIESGEADYKFGAEEREQLLSIGLEETDFVLTGVDEWTYIGGSLESLLGAINKNVDGILNKLKEPDVEQGELFEKNKNKTTFQYVDPRDIHNNIELGLIETIEGLQNGILTYYIKGSSGEKANEENELALNRWQLENIASTIGIDPTQYKDNQTLVDAIVAAYERSYGENGEIYFKALEDELKAAQMEAFEANSQYLYDNALKGDETAINAIVAQARLLGVSDIYVQEALKALNDAADTDKSSFKKLIDIVFLKEAQEELQRTSEAIEDIIGECEDLSNLTEEDKLNIAVTLGLNNLSSDKILNLFDNTDFSSLLKQIFNEGKTELLPQLLTLAFGTGLTFDEKGYVTSGDDDVIQSLLNSNLIRQAYAEDVSGRMVVESYDDTEQPITFGTRTQGEGFALQISSDALANVFKGNGSSEEAKDIENSLDRQYTNLQDINAAMREREKLERKYNQLIESGMATREEILKYSNEQLGHLEKEEELWKLVLEGRNNELAEALALNNGRTPFGDLVKWDSDNNTLEINWDEINNLLGTDTYEEIIDYIEEIEDIQSKIQEAEDSLADIKEDTQTIKNRGEDEYTELENRIMEALIEEQARAIEAQEKLYEAITEASSDLVDAIQSNIDQMRQDRENRKTEESLAEKERRLAYLRQDTSGANQMEIQELEKELMEAREDYSDTLVDQALQDLQDQNDIAAEQRDKQIELMNSQLEENKNSGYYAQKAHEMLENAFEKGEIFNENSEFYRLITTTEDWGTLAHSETIKKLEELKTSFALAGAYFDKLAASDNNWDTITRDYARYDYQEAMSLIATEGYKGILTKDKAFSLIQDYEAMRDEKIGTYVDDTHTLTYGQQFGVEKTNGKIAAAFREANSYEEFKEKLKGLGIYEFATGGLADFTGPAWLDGTKSHPELVLNARDTENFIMLRDILSSLFQLPTSDTSSSGDNYFDIDIQVDEISDDYDVDQMVERVKQKIYEDSMYRNNNVIQRIR